MEGNKDESNNCIKIAEKYIKTGDFEKANKFLNKAERLFPSDHAKSKIFAIFHLVSLLFTLVQVTYSYDNNNNNNNNQYNKQTL